MMKLLLLTCLAAVALADPYYYYGHQQHWPSVRGYGFSATCFGCRGKRSADAEPEAEADAYYGYPYYGYGYGYRTPGYGYTHVHRFGKRSAEPEPYYGFYGYYPYAYGPGIAGHPTGTSYTQRSPQGLRGKRSADEAEAPEQAYGAHPNGGKSFVGQTVWGFRLLNKRSAEPEPYYYGYPGYGYHGYGGNNTTMLRSAASIAARRTVLNSKGSQACLAPKVNFHASAKRDEEAKAAEPAPVEKGGLFGTGLSEWFALPIGMTMAVPALKLDWYVVNEETQLAAVFVAFCVACYTQGGDAVYKSLDERAQTLLKEHNEAEDKVIAALEQKLDFLKANQNMVNDFEAINKIREESYANLNAAGVIKPQHDMKAQVERMLNMIAQEEANVTEKTKIAIMEEATAAVTEKFSTSKALKKAALDAAIAQIKGSAAEGTVDPVRAEFSSFLKAKAEAASKVSGDEEMMAQRAAMVAKMNAVAKSEGFFFELDADAKPVMKA